MRAGSRCEKSASSSRLIVPPVVCPGTSYAGPLASLSTENRIFSFASPPVVLPPVLVPPPVLLPPHAVAARASSPLTATSRTPVLRLIYEPFVLWSSPAQGARGVVAIHQVLFGSSASRTESPNRLKHRTSRNRASPGKS